MSRTLVATLTLPAALFSCKARLPADFQEAASIAPRKKWSARPRCQRLSFAGGGEGRRRGKPLATLGNCLPYWVRLAKKAVFSNPRLRFRGLRHKRSIQGCAGRRGCGEIAPECVRRALRGFPRWRADYRGQRFRRRHPGNAEGVIRDRTGRWRSRAIPCLRGGISCRGAHGMTASGRRHRRPIEPFQGATQGWPIKPFQGTTPGWPAAHAAGSRPRRTPPIAARRSRRPSLPCRDAPAGNA